MPNRMIGAAAKALGDLFSKPFRAILWKSLALTILLFAALFFGVQLALSYLDLARFEWLEPIIAIVAGLGVLASFIFLATPVTAIFAGLFMDHVAALVESSHYSKDAPGRPLPAVLSLVTALRFAFVVLVVNLMALPFLLIGIGAIAMLLANSYLLSREFFEMASLRHLPRNDAARLRRRHSRRIFIAGLLPAALAFVPFANLIVPLFSTSYFTHLYKSLAPPGAAGSLAGKGKDRG